MDSKLRRRPTPASSRDPSPPPEILEQSEQEAIVDALLEEALRAKKWQDGSVKGVQAILAGLIFFALPLRTTLTILLSCLLLISAFAPTLHPRQAELFVALTLVLPLYAFISNAEEKPALWAGSGAIIVGTVVRSASQRMVDDAKGLDKLRYSAPEA